MRSLHGFNLLEILIALVIMSILTSLCFPLYSHHVAEERRIEAKITLEKLAAALELYYLTHNNYQLKITSLTDTTFSLAATPEARQAEQDILCKTLMINAAGGKSITGKGQISDCWG